MFFCTLVQKFYTEKFLILITERNVDPNLWVGDTEEHCTITNFNTGILFFSSILSTSYWIYITLAILILCKTNIYCVSNLPLYLLQYDDSEHFQLMAWEHDWKENLFFSNLSILNYSSTKKPYSSSSICFMLKVLPSIMIIRAKMFP